MGTALLPTDPSDPSFIALCRLEMPAQGVFFNPHPTLAPLGICGIMNRENDPGGPHHAGTSQPATANRRLRR